MLSLIRLFTLLTSQEEGRESGAHTSSVLVTRDMNNTASFERVPWLRQWEFFTSLAELSNDTNIRKDCEDAVLHNFSFKYFNMPLKKKSPKKSVNSTLDVPSKAPFSMETVTADCIEPFLEGIRDRKTVESYRKTVRELEEVENRRARARGDGYYRKFDACHKHFAKKLAVFYRYDDMDLHILDIKEHINDSNKY